MPSFTSQLFTHNMERRGERKRGEGRERRGERGEESDQLI
jgi:hypothetical protein